MVRSSKKTAFWKFMMVAMIMALAVAACVAPAAEPAATPVSLPEVTLNVSDAEMTVSGQFPAGVVAMTINNSGQIPHAPLLARLNDGVTRDQFMKALEADESGMAAVSLVSLAGGTEAGPGKSVRAIFDLNPGDYIALDFGEGPPLMATFSVGTADGQAAAEPVAAINVDLLDFQFALPDQVKAGEQMWKIENKGGQWHEMVIFKMDEGVTTDDLLQMVMSEEPPEGQPPFEQVAIWAPMSPGQRAWMTVDLPQGTYTVLCFLPDFASNPPVPHMAHGMVRTLTVTQ